MKKFTFNAVSLALAVWYLFSILGFTNHVCSSTGETFFLSLLEDSACASVHPHHHCQDSCCAHESSEDSAEAVLTQECCSNDLYIITIAGDREEDETKGLSADWSGVSLVAVLPEDCYTCCGIAAGLDPWNGSENIKIGPEDRLNLLYCVSRS